MVEILPAIIPESFEDLQDKMSVVNGLVETVQVDICDGKFVPSKSWPYIHDREGEFQKLIHESDGFPFWDSLDFEIHLMVEEPQTVAEDWIRVGAKRIVLHIESSHDILNFVKKLRDEYGYSEGSVFSIEIGIALKMETPINLLDVFLTPDASGKTLIDFVQFMGIQKIGFQQQGFDDAVLEKIQDLRKKYPTIPISVDGGVDFENASALVDAGATRLVSGSALYESEDIKEAIEEMQNS